MLTNEKCDTYGSSSGSFFDALGPPVGHALALYRMLPGVFGRPDENRKMWERDANVGMVLTALHKMETNFAGFFLRVNGK